MALTSQDKEDDPVHDQNGPEDGHVEELEPGAEKRDDDGPRGPVPELELGQAADKGLELFVLPGGEGTDGAVLHVIVGGFVGRVELGLQEGEEQVEQVDSQGIGNWEGNDVSFCFRARMQAGIPPQLSSGGQRWRRIPIYHPCAKKMRRKKATREMPVPTHRYRTKGVD